MMQSNRKILALDDSADVIASLQDYLRDYEFTLYTALNIKEATGIIEKEEIDLLLVDLKLKNESGLDFAKFAYEKYSMPIIMISAVTDPVEKILGLETVLVDYLEKPFDPRYLLAKIRAHIRMSFKLNDKLIGSDYADHQENKDDDEIISFGGFFIDKMRAQLISKEDGPVDLRNSEYRLLELLASTANQVLSRQEIVEQLGLDSSNTTMRNIDVLVLRLRRKIESTPSTPRFLQTRRNKGYVFCLR